MSDAMWRIYSPNALGIRIGTTRQRLDAALSRAVEVGQITDYTTKDVRYEKSAVVQRNLRNLGKILGKSSRFEFVAAALTIKRDAFEHEQEVRVIVTHDQWPTDKKILGREIEIDPFQLVRSVLVDPRAPEEFLDAYRHYFANVIGFAGKVDRSGLYAVPESISPQNAED